MKSSSNLYRIVVLSGLIFNVCGMPFKQECVRGALKGKTTLLVTHQVDFLHNVDQILVSLFVLMLLCFVRCNLQFDSESYSKTYVCAC